MTWTAGDFTRALAAAHERGTIEDLEVLSTHHIYEGHCEGYEVLAWPCAPAAKVLDRLLGGVA